MRVRYRHTVMDLKIENCRNLCTTSRQFALLSQIVMVCGSTKHSDIFEISNRLVSTTGGNGRYLANASSANRLQIRLLLGPTFAELPIC